MSTKQLRFSYSSITKKYNYILSGYCIFYQVFAH